MTTRRTKLRQLSKILLISATTALLGGSLAFAQEFTSTSFKILDPVIYSGGYSTSDSYRLTGVITQIGTGTSTSSSFGVNGGFLYFPFVTTPTVTATAGDAQVALSWTASTGYVGWTVSSYDIGRSTVSGGPYTYTSLGNVTSSTVTGLSNGTTYYFVVRPEDAFTNAIATSSEVSATPAAAAPPPPAPSGGGGGGGGGYIAPSGATAIFSGKSYPRSDVTILKDAQVASTVKADSNGLFSLVLNNLSSGTFLFSVYAEDYQGRRSSLLSFPVNLSAGLTANISGIFIPPTIAVDKSEVRRGDPIAIFGQTTPQARLNVVINSDDEYIVKPKADSDGLYKYDFDTDPLDFGQHYTKSNALLGTEVSIFGPVIAFKVGNKNVLVIPTTKCPLKGDVNGDCRVNLVDFSIVGYWWRRPLTENAKGTIDAKLSADGVITLKDFSILAYYWTG